MFQKTVASIMGDFSKKVTALKKLQSQKNKEITARNQQIKTLKATNMTDQAEISSADRAITFLGNF